MSNETQKGLCGMKHMLCEEWHKYYKIKASRGIVNGSAIGGSLFKDRHTSNRNNVIFCNPTHQGLKTNRRLFSNLILPYNQYWLHALNPG